MSLSQYVRLLAAACGVVVVSLAVSAARCDDDEGNNPPPEFSCTDLGSDARFTRFVLYDQSGGSDMSRACAYDRVVEPAGDCSLIVWSFPHLGDTPNQIDNELGGQVYFQYLTGQTCVQSFDSQLDYTLDTNDQPVTGNRFVFLGQWIRNFDSGTGPFATGTWQEFDENFSVLATGCFDFYEDAGITVVDQVCQLEQ